MMLIIYDNNGKIIMTATGDYTGASAIVHDVPDGYTVESVNVETGEPVLTPIPATEEERMAAIEKSYQAAAGTHAGSYTDPIPFVYGMPVEKGKYYTFGGVTYSWMAADVSACVWFPDSGIWEWSIATDPAEEATGTIDDPIEAVSGMAYIYGKYYRDPSDNLTYYCMREGETEGNEVILYYLPHELVGQYFELAAEA